MASLRPYLVGFALVLLVSTFSYLFMSEIIGRNNPGSLSLSNPVNSSIEDIQSATDSVETIGTTVKNLIGGAELSAEYLFIITKASWEIPLAVIGFLVSGTSAVLTLVFTGLFGSGNSKFNIALGVFTGILGITIGLVILKAMRTGETER